MTTGMVHFMHGKESGSGGSKIAALAAVARTRGWDVACLDYSDTVDPAVRVEVALLRGRQAERTSGRPRRSNAAAAVHSSGRVKNRSRRRVSLGR